MAVFTGEGRVSSIDLGVGKHCDRVHVASKLLNHQLASMQEAVIWG